MEIQTEQAANGFREIKLFSGPGTRQWPRFNISDVPSIKGVRSSAGSRIKIINISRGGALLQTWRHQVPGTRIRLKVETTEGITQLNSIALRSSVFATNGILRYQVAVAFNCPLQIPDAPAIQCVETPQAVLDPSFIPEADSSTNYGLSFKSTPSEDISMIEAFLSIKFFNEPDEKQDEMLILNDW